MPKKRVYTRGCPTRQGTRATNLPMLLWFLIACTSLAQGGLVARGGLAKPVPRIVGSARLPALADKLRAFVDSGDAGAPVSAATGPPTTRLQEDVDGDFEDLDEESPARAGSPMMMAEARADGFLLHSLQ